MTTRWFNLDDLTRITVEIGDAHTSVSVTHQPGSEWARSYTQRVRTLVHSVMLAVLAAADSGNGVVYQSLTAPVVGDLLGNRWSRDERSEAFEGHIIAGRYVRDEEKGFPIILSDKGLGYASAFQDFEGAGADPSEWLPSDEVTTESPESAAMARLVGSISGPVDIFRNGI
ncbi:MAG: hypothetical protein L6R40_008743 [Gallowayella cf. fulva]|nr:MAG: hypothetical protein L6R40_008743 [Xanthomendoza cf. fulva]